MGTHTGTDPGDRAISNDELRTEGEGAGRPDDDRPRLVLVDDEPDILFLLERLLATHGFAVAATAADGHEGIEAVAETQPDAVLLDLAMPTLDGEAALPTLVLEAPHTMVVVLSSHVDPARSRALLSRGAFAVYDKVDLDDIGRVLGEDLARFRRALDGEDTVPVLRSRRSDD